MLRNLANMIIKDDASRYPVYPPWVDENLTIKDLSLRGEWIRWSEVLVSSLEKVLLPS